jgi:NAD(P)-dependent dehydrogenase (short-subunit alcohol dehydrogenase family)
VVDVDLGGVVEGTRQVVRRLRAAGAPGVIVINASSAGIFPVPGREVYAAAKAGAVHLARSLAHLAPSHGIRVCAVCPRFVDTNMVARMLVRALRSQRSVKRPPLSPHACIALHAGSGPLSGARAHRRRGRPAAARL